MVAPVTVTRHTKLFNDQNGDGKVTPGDTILTEITIKNATGSSITGVVANDTLANGTTYVAGTIVVTTGDQYTGLVGNTPISFGASEGVLANDYHFDGGFAGTNTGLTVTTINGTAIGAAITIHDASVPATVAGTVNVAANGSFIFTPATGYLGTAAFTYTDSDGNGVVGTGTVTLTVSSQIWYVDSTYAGANGASDGSFLKPFTDFTNLNGGADKDAPGDSIVVHGSPTGTLTLEAGEALYGDGVLHKVDDAYTVNGVTHNTGATTVTSGSGTSTMSASGTAVITLSTNNIIDGISVNTNGATVGIVDNGGSVTTSGGTLTIAHTTVAGSSQAVSITHGGNLAASFTSISSSGGATAVNLAGTATSGTGLLSGSFAASGGTITGNTAKAFVIGTSATAGSGGNADITYAGTINNTATGAVDVESKNGGSAAFSGNVTYNGTGNGITVNNNTAGTTSFTGQSISMTTTVGTGVNLTNNTGATITFNPTSGGTGLDVSATTGAGMVFTGGGTLNVQGSGNSVSTTTGHILDFANGTIGANNVAFANLTATGQVSGTAISLNNVDSNSFSGGVVSIAGATADGIAITGGSTSAITFGNTTIGTGGTAVASDGISVTSNTGSNVTFNGTVAITTSSGGQGINLDTDTGTIAFTGGSSKTIVTSSGDAIHIANNGAAVSFTNGGLVVTTTSGDGIDAAGTTPSATNALTISGGNNQINTTSGMGVKISGVQTDVVLTGVKVTAATTDGIYINNGGTTAASKFVISGQTSAANNTLTGTGAAATNGDHLTGTGIYLNNIANVDISKMIIAGDWNNFGIRGDNVFGFGLHDSTLNGTYGDSNADDEDAIRFGTASGGTESPSGTTGVIGTATFDGNTIGGGWEDNLDFYVYGSNTTVLNIKDNTTTLAPAIFNVTQNPGTSGSGNDNIFIGSGSNSNLTVTIDGIDVRGAHGDLLQIVASDNTTQNITVKNSTFNNNFSAATSGNTIGGDVYIGGGGNSATYHATFTIDNNTFKGAKDTAVQLIYGGATQVVSGTFTNNVIGTNNGGGATLTDGTGSSSGNGLEFDIVHQAGGGQSTGAIRIQGNQIYDWQNLAGIALYATGNSSNTGSELLEATILNNTIAEGSNSAANGSLGGIYAWAGSKNTSDAGTIGLNISGNTITAPDTAADIYLDQYNTDPNSHYNIPGYLGATGGAPASTNLTTFWGGSNTLSLAAGAYQAVDANSTVNITHNAFTLGVPLLVTPPPPVDPNAVVGERNGDTETVVVTDPNAPTGGTTGTGTGTGTDTGSTGTTPPPPPPAPTSTITHNLTQADLDTMVAAAIHRWELAGATAEQIAAMKAVSVTVADIAGLGVGDSTPGHIVISSSGAGYGWFIDATPNADEEFEGTGTDLNAAPGTLPYGHVDLLTVIEHELGHQIGLNDDYNAADAADLMYGFVNAGERRLPAGNDVAAATGTAVDHESFVLSSVTVGTIVAGNSVDVSYQSTVNAFSPGLAPTLTGSSTVSGSFGSPLTASESMNTTNDTMTDSAGTVTTQALAISSLTLGNLVYQDVNKNGAFDAGDTGVNGVTVKLYVDNGSIAGVWDASDTLVTSTTTATVLGQAGTYSFTGLAEGDYIVVIPSTNFGTGNPLGALVPHNGAGDPDDNVDNDNNGIAMGGVVASQAITLAYDTEPTAGAGNDTNNTLDFGFQTNSPPTAVADTLAATDEDTPKTYAATDFTTNDSDPDGDTFSITSVTNGAHGTATLNGDGTVTYTPAADYNGSDTFTYTVTDSHGASSTANANVTINAVNDPVTSNVPLPVTVNEDSGSNAVTGLSISDVDAALAPAGVYEVTLSATYGTLTLTTLTGLTFSGGDGTGDTTMTFHGTLSAINTALATAHYTPDANYAGSAQIELQATDTFNNIVATGSGTATSDDQTVAVTVTSINDAPSVTDESATTDDATNYVFGASDFTADFSDSNDSPANAPANVIITSLPTTGTLIYDGTTIIAGSLPFTISIADLDAGKLVYDPADSSGGSDYGFGFKVQDDGTTANGGQDTSSAHIFTMHVLVSDLAPVMDLDTTTGGIDNTADYTEQAAPTILAANIAVSDSDDTDLTGAIVDLCNTFQPGDVLSINGLTSGTVGSISFSYDDTTGYLTLTGTASLADYQALLQQVAFSSTSDAPGTSREVEWTVNDGTLDSDVATTILTITPVNDAPSGTDSTVSTPEDTPYTLHAGDFGFTDPDGDSLGSVTINSVSGGTLYYDADGAGGADPVAVGTFPATFAAADLSADKVTFVPTANLNGTGAGSIVFLVTDDSGQADDTSTSPNTLTIDLNPINDAPNIPNSPTIAATEQTAITINAALAVSDVDLDARNGGNGDYGGAAFVINRDVSNPEDLFSFNTSGALFTVNGNNLQSGGLTFATFTTSGGILNISFTSSGTTATTALVNDVLQHLQYTNLSDTPPASVTLLYVIDDGAPGGGQGTVTGFNNIDGGQVVVNITAINDAPVNTTGGTIGTGEDAVNAWMSGISVSDPDADPATAVMIVSLSVAHGTITIRTDVSGGIGSGDIIAGGNGTNQIVIQGTQNEINATLAATNGLTYTPTANYNGADGLTITTSDAGATGTDPGLTGTGSDEQDSDVRTISISAVNDAPTVVNGTTQAAPAINEDSPPSNLTAPTVSTLFSGHYSDAADAQFSLANPGGSSPGAFTGIAVTANGSNANGQWQYYNGSAWVDIGAVSNASALTLGASTPIRFNPAANYNGPAPTLDVHLADNSVSITNGAHIDLSGVGATGGTTAWSTGTVTLTETVNPVNDAPVLDLNGAGAGTSVTIAYTEGDPLKLIAPSGAITDIDSANFNNGVLTVAFTANGTTDDVLQIKDQGTNAGQISISGNTIFYQFGFILPPVNPGDPPDSSNSDIEEIGTFTGGDNGTPLVITFDNPLVTPAIAQKVLEDIAYENVSQAPSEQPRTLTFTLAESDGTTSSPVTATINVTAIDNPAILSDDFGNTDEVHPTNVAVLANDNDPDGPPPTVAKINGQNATVGVPIILPSGALATLKADGTINYDPNHKFDTLTNPAGGETGASNTSAVDTFTYTTADGSTATVVVTIDGVAGPGDWLRGSDGNDIITGTSGNDLFMMQDGILGPNGGDAAFGLGGNDAFYYGAAMNPSDANDGGDGRDVVILQGNYSGGFTLGAHNLDNIEALSLQSGSITRWGDNGTHLYSYDITSVDANVAAGKGLIVNGNNLLAGENFTFNGSAETDGSFVFYGGFGTDHLTGGAGNDVFYFEGDRWNPTDIANGGSGRDVVVVTGSLNGINHIDVASGQLVNIDAFSVSNVYAFNPATLPSYEVVIHDGNVTPGGSLIVNANTLTKPTQTFALDAHEVTGTLLVFGGAGDDTIVTGSGNDIIYAGFGQDILTGGAGQDVFQYRSVGDSTIGAADHILDFHTGTDKIDFSYIDADPSTAANDAFVFSNDGTFHGIKGEIREFFDAAHGWWVVDADVNGDGQADMSIHVTTTGGNVDPLAISDFIL